MTRTRRFLNGFLSGYAHLLVATAAGLWLTPFFLARLGQETYGLWLVGTQVLAYLLLMDFGIVALLPREAAYVTGRTGMRDGAELRVLVEKALTLAVAQTPFVLAAAGLAVFWLQGSWAGLRVPLALVLALFVLTFPLRVFGAALTGLQDLAFVARAQFLAWGAGTAVTLLLVLRGYGLGALAAGWCVTQALVIGACTARLAALFPAAMPKGLRIRESLASRDYIMRSLWVSVSQVSQVLLNGTDMMIIGALLGPAAVVPYACTGKLATVLANQPQAILQSAAPALSELRTAGSRDRLFRVSAALAQATLAVSGLVACVVLAVNAGFVTWWVGPEQFGGMPLTMLLLTAMMIRHFNTTNVYALFCFGFERRLALTGLADGVVTIGASYVFVRAFGIAGAPVGALAGVLLVSAPLNIAALARETGVGRAQMLASLGPWLSRLALATGVAALAGRLVQPAAFLPLAVLGGLAGVVYAVAVVAPLMRSPAGEYLQPFASRIGRIVPMAVLRGADRRVPVQR